MKIRIMWLVALVMGLCLFIPVVSAESASISDLTVSINKDKQVEITGTISSGAGNQVTTRIIDPEGNLEFLDQTTSQAEGEFEFSYTMKNSLEGSYQVIVSGTDVAAPVSDEFNYTCACNNGNSGFIGAWITPITSSGGNASLLTMDLNPSNATATAKVDEAKFNELLGQTEEDQDGDESVVLDIPKMEDATSYKLSFPSSVLASLGVNRTIRIQTEVGTLIVPGNMFPPGMLQDGQDIELLIGIVDQSELHSTIIQLQLYINGQSVKWDNPDAFVTVQVPYTPPASEAARHEHIVVKYIDDLGNESTISNGKYDPDTQSVIFRTNHFSMFAIAFELKTFTDLTRHEWARKGIEVLSSKGIIHGTSETTFQPGLSITRADFLVLLMKTLELTTEVSDNFSDVPVGSYFYQAVGSAKKLGITSGVGDNQFLPREAITRQEMMVLAAQALAVANKLEVANGSDTVLKKFTDREQIAPYAVKSVSALIRSGLIQGSGDKIMPLSATTRAETAVFMYQIYNYSGGVYVEEEDPADEAETVPDPMIPAPKDPTPTVPVPKDPTPATPVPIKNLLEDGGFETGNLELWSITGAASKFVITQDMVRSGDYALKISGPQNFSFISQSIDVTPGTDYVLSFYARGTSNFVYRVTGPPLVEKADSLNNDTEWKKYTFSFTAPMDKSTLRFDMTDIEEGKVAYVDDIEIYESSGIVESDPGKNDPVENKPAPVVPAPAAPAPVAPAPVVETGPNLLTNGGFESGDQSSWAITGAASKFVLTQETVRTGKYALEISGPQNFAFISQSIDVIPGASYQLTFYAKGTSNFTYRVTGPPLVEKADSSNSESEWNKYTLNFTAPMDKSKLRVDITDVLIDTNAYVDDVELRLIKK